MIVARCMCVPGPGEQHARGCPEWRPSATETSEPADPPGCVWRGKDPFGSLLSVAPWLADPASVWVWCQDDWHEGPSWARVDEIGNGKGWVEWTLRAWGLSERSRADAAEATLAAMRAGIERVMREMRGGGT